MTDEGRHTALHDGACQGDYQLVKSLLTKPMYKENVNEKGVGGWCALHYGARSGNEDVVKALLDAKASVALKTNKGDAALHLSAEAGHFKVVRLLLDAKAMPSIEDAKGRTPGAQGAQNLKSKTTQGRSIILDKGRNPWSIASSFQSFNDFYDHCWRGNLFFGSYTN